MLYDGAPLGGGNLSGAFRQGDHVHRAAGVWTPTVHRLLRYLASSGISWVPTPARVDQRFGEVLSFLPGVVPHDPMPEWMWTDSVLIDAVRHLARLHEVTVDYRDVGARWQLPVHEPAEVICHNDFAPYNMVFDEDHQLVGVIDWDTASPGPRVWDLAYLAYRMVPLTAPGNPDGIDSSIVERRRRLALLCDSYASGQSPAGVLSAAIPRLEELVEFTERRAAEGASHVRAHVDLYRDAGRWITLCYQSLTRPSD